MVEISLLAVGEAHDQAAKRLVGVYARNHREKGRKEAGLGRHLAVGREKHCEKADDERGYRAGSHNVKSEYVGLHHKEAGRMAYGGYDGAKQVGLFRRVAYGCKPYGRDSCEKRILKKLNQHGISVLTKTY